MSFRLSFLYFGDTKTTSKMKRPQPKLMGPTCGVFRAVISWLEGASERSRCFVEKIFFGGVELDPDILGEIPANVNNNPDQEFPIALPI